MPRNHNAGPSTLRNRNRVTNKTRLKVITETIDADSIVVDEDEEKARVVSTAGVDAEDANEHHLQAVLSAAATRHQSITRSTRGTLGKDKPPPAFIPTPDSTGVVDNYEAFYPPGRWKDASTYLKFSDTVEESMSFALASGFIYYMDERDKEWLDRNNAEAGGEGTSVQGAVSGASTRSGRGSKAKGKDPEISQPVAMSEDEFELVMAIFEKVTHEKTEFLHHGLEQGTPFPPFSDYQDTFAEELQPSMFALYAVPHWIPTSAHLSRLARAIYPHWRERRVERGGHPIIPTVNLDETDAKNESYICFRRREIKAVRKTRAQQATYSDRMLRLQAELSTTFELANDVLQREELKRESLALVNLAWVKRIDLSDMKRKFPSLAVKEDDDLLVEKERVVKKAKQDTLGRLKLPKARDSGDLSPVAQAEHIVRPKERLAQIRTTVEHEMTKRKEKDQKWEDVVDNPYQPSSQPYPSKLFKFITAARTAAALESSPRSENASSAPVRSSRAGRLRFGRGGRLHLDRRTVPATVFLVDPSLSDDDVEAKERRRGLAERWRFDADDVPAAGPEGPEAKDRVLVDDYDTRFLIHHMSLLSEQDMTSFVTDPSITVTLNDGRQQTIIPFRPGSQGVYGRSAPPLARPNPALMAPGRPVSAMQPSSSGLSVSQAGTPVSVPTQLKQMPPPSVPVPHMRISSNGGMRPPGLPAVPARQMQSPPLSSPPAASSLASNDNNGTNGNMGDDSDQPTKLPATMSPRVQQQGAIDQQAADAGSAVTPSASPMRTKVQAAQTITMPSVPNGYHIPNVNAYSASMPNATYMHPSSRLNGLTLQQMQNMKSAAAYASMTSSTDNTTQATNANVHLRGQASFLQNGHPNYATLANARHMQWAAVAAAQQQQRPPSANPAEANVVDGMTTSAMSPSLSAGPVRTPSANGMRTPLSRGMTVPGAVHAMGQASAGNPHMVRLATPLTPSPHLLNSSLSATQPQASPTRSPQPPMASPSLQARQAVGSSGAGY